MSDGVGKTSWSPPNPRSIPIPGRRGQDGKHCPNCDFPIADSKAVVIARTPASAEWKCPHCGWIMKVSIHEAGHDNHEPGGRLLARRF